MPYFYDFAKDSYKVQVLQVKKRVSLGDACTFIDNQFIDNINNEKNKVCLLQLTI